MRTTLTLDDDLADKLKQLAEDRRQPFRQVVNEVVRRGLTAVAPRRPATPFKVRPFRSAFRAGVDPAKLNQLLDDLDAHDALDRAPR